ncbi:MAG: ABC transporter substrate-binding protein, partial [Actinobacteria bacterium]|nr:ABC transporter substrate-binding protein [Actinomycetota bacterium]
VLMVATACQGGTAPQGGAQNTEADIDLSGPVSVTLWHTQTGSNAKALQDMVDKFNSSNGKGVTVVMEYQGGYTQLYQKTLGAIQAGALPEIAVGYESFVADYQKANVVLDLDPYVGSKKNGLAKESLDDIFKTYLDTNRFPQFENKLLSFPFTKSLLIMYQNDDVLKSAGQTSPRTWDEFEKAARAATQKGADGKVTRYGWAAPTSASTFNGWVLSRGGQLMSEDNKTVRWDGKEGVEAVKLFQKLLGEGVAYVPKGFDYQTDFGVGKVAFVQESSTGRPFFVSSFPKDKPAPNWTITGIPQTDPAKAKTVQYGANIIAFRSTPEKQLASWMFIKWFADGDQTADWAIKSSYMPVRKSAVDNAALKTYWAKDTQGKAAFDLSGTAVPEPNARGQQDIRTVIEDMLTAIATGKATDAEKAVKDAGVKANAILKENQ